MKKLLLLLTLLFVGYAGTTFAAATQDNETPQLSKTEQEFISLGVQAYFAEVVTRDDSTTLYTDSLVKPFTLYFCTPTTAFMSDLFHGKSEWVINLILMPAFIDILQILFKKNDEKKLLSSLDALENFIKGLSPEQRREVVHSLNLSKDNSIYKMIYGEKKVDSTTKKTRILRTVIDVGVMATWAILLLRKLPVFKDKALATEFRWVNEFIRRANLSAEETESLRGECLNEYSDILDNEVAYGSKLIFLALFVDAAIIFAKNFYFTSDEDEKKAILDRIKNMLAETDEQKSEAGITS